MSSYNAAQVRFNACVRAVASLVPDLEASAGRVRAAVLRDVARHVPNARTVEQLDRLWQIVVEQVPSQDRLLGTLAPREWQQAEQLRDQARIGTTAQRDRCVELASGHLRDALERSAAALGQQERRLVAAIAERAATNLGYSVIRRDGTDVTGIEARRGHEVIAIKVADEGRLELDHAGLTDRTCVDRQAALEHEMARLGADIQTVSGEQHGSVQGGVLIARAARRRQPTLADGIVADHEAPSIYERRSRAETQPRRVTS